MLRIGLFYNNRALIIENVAKAKKMIDDGGDWDRRNRLKVYEGLYLLTIRDFKYVTTTILGILATKISITSLLVILCSFFRKAAEMFLGAISTFTSYELMDYDNFIKWAVIT